MRMNAARKCGASQLDAAMLRNGFPWSWTSQDIQTLAIRPVLEIVSLGLGVIGGGTIAGISDRIELHAVFLRRKMAVSADPVETHVRRGNSGAFIVSEWISVSLNQSSTQ